MTQLDTLKAQHTQARKAFLHDPTPRLGTALKQLEASIRYQTRAARKAKP